MIGSTSSKNWLTFGGDPVPEIWIWILGRFQLTLDPLVEVRAQSSYYYYYW